MIKLRDARYCNLKVFLIFLVIYGHLIEPYIWTSEILMTQYKWIYLIHMPLFSFVSGLFLADARTCQRQFLKTFPLYVFLQVIAVLFGKGNVKLLTPYWHLWYLLSYSIWSWLAWIWFRFSKGKGKIIILVCSFFVGCIAGFVPFIGREFSLSRTLVFLPYFWIGFICNPTFLWKKLRPVGVIALLIAVILMIFEYKNIPVTFLYHARSYGKLENGVMLRVLCYILSGTIGIFILAFTSSKRFPFTKIGVDTMPAYIIHVLLILYVQKCNIPCQFYIVIAIGFMYVIYMIVQWYGKLYGIVYTERRDVKWLPLKKSMRNMLNRSIGSYYP